MRKFLMITSLCLAAAWVTPAAGRAVPWGYSLEEGTRVVAYVTHDCPECETLIERLWGLGVVFVGSEPDLPYPNYLWDERELIARTLRIIEAPTVVLLQGGHEVQRHVTQRIDPEVIHAAVSALHTGALQADRLVDLTIGERVPSHFEDFTGLVVFWRETCEPCEREAQVLVEVATSLPLEVRVVPAGQDVPPELERAETLGIREAWGIGGHVRVLLSRGVPVWIDMGAREDLMEILQDLVALLETINVH
jgi:thiol-disulfide isomerase/thioredoxin